VLQYKGVPEQCALFRRPRDLNGFEDTREGRPSKISYSF
jgi:hypothetical protein